MFSKLDEEIKQEDQLYLESLNKSKEVKENEFGDKISGSDGLAGVIFWVGVASLMACACARGYQEYKKHHNRVPEKSNIIQIHNIR